MLQDCDPTEFELHEWDAAASEFVVFNDRPEQGVPYAVTNPEVAILDGMSAKLTATFRGPQGSSVIGRAWISDADGGLAEEKTDEIPAGTREELVLTIPETKVQNGDLIACMRVEWPLRQAKHVVRWTLRKGEFVHPPKGKDC